LLLYKTLCLASLIYSSNPTLLKRFFWILFVGGTILLALAYLLACFTPIVSAANWLVMGYLGLAFPVLLLAMALAVLIWLFVNKRAALILAAIFLLGSYHISHLFAWHFSQRPFSPGKAAGSIRIMGWNMQNLSHFATLGYNKETNGDIGSYLQQMQPDVVCIQDFGEVDYHKPPTNADLLSRSANLPYHYFSYNRCDTTPWGRQYSGIAIFSKYPLQHIQRVFYKDRIRPETILTADITINNVTRRIITTHLQSMYLKKLKMEDKHSWIYDEDSTINYSESVVKKLSHYFPYHAKQAREVRQVIDASPYPVIFSADMNEVPTSYCYRMVKGNLNDVFLQKGSGLGRTYYRISPTLRIDYLFTSPGTEVMQYKRDTVELSDHYPQIMDVKW
jgi:endonuclease/exonuclease/phosphatase family metal-dependent hydrolase